MYRVTPVILAYLNFYFNQPVLYAIDNKWPSESPEKSGKWMGVAHNIGDALTYKILMDDTKKIITIQPLGPAMITNPNNHLETFSSVEGDKPIKSVIKSKE